MNRSYTRRYLCAQCGRTTTRTYKAGSRSPSKVRHWCGGEAKKIWPEGRKNRV